MTERRTIRVFLCDDNPEVVSAVGELLKTDPLIEIIGSAGSAESMITAVAEARPDVIVLDNYLPGITGLDAVVRMRNAGNMTPVVLLTADPRLRQRAADLENTTFFAKAITEADELLGAVRGAASGAEGRTTG